MAYVDVTLTPAATYTYVHNGQIYDQIATTLAAHSNWQYVEYVDATPAATTYRRHVWRCKAAGTGLPSDFYVMFQTSFLTATGVYSTSTPVYLMLAEGYASGTLSKIATLEASVTPASDLTNPATWALSTYAAPASAFWQANSRNIQIGPTSNQTSVRLLYLVAKDGLMSNYGPNSTGSGSAVVGSVVYVGMYDTLLGANDPMPIVMFTTAGTSSAGAGAATRAPLQTAGVAVTEVFAVSHNDAPNTGTGTLGASNPRNSTNAGSLGLPSNTGWVKSDGGVRTFRGYLSSFTTTLSTSSAKGIVRGYPRYVRTTNSNLATHSAGDTFLVDGKVYLGLGNYVYGIWDTTAT